LLVSPISAERSQNDQSFQWPAFVYLGISDVLVSQGQNMVDAIRQMA
jgi:hypothetical protein